jgi:hypothetical protein
MAINFDEDITARIARQRKQQMAATMGKTVEQMDQDSEYFDEIKAIDAGDKYVSDQEAAEEAAEMKEWAAYNPKKSGPQPESEAARNARLEGERQATVLEGGGAPEKMDTGTYTALDAASATQQQDGIMDDEYNKKLWTRSPWGNEDLFGPYKTVQREEDIANYEGWLENQEVSPEGFHTGKEKPRATSSEEYLARPPVEDVAGENQMVQAEKGLMPIEDAEAQIDEIAAAGEQSDFQRDENDPAVKEMKESQTNDEVRKEVLKDVPKEEIAMVKEELGNYYIGPGGYAINLDKVESDSKRGANFLMLQHVPVHARSQMLANWGYIDQEDVDKLPDSPTVQVAKINADMELAKQTAANKTDLTKTDKVTQRAFGLSDREITARKELNTSNNTLKRELALSDDEFRKLDLEDKNWRFMEKQELTAYMHNNGIDFDEKKLEVLQSHQFAQINLGYSQIRSKEKVEKNMLTFKNKQWGDQYKIASKQEKRAMLLQEHTKGMDVINMAMDNGQLDLAAATAVQMGLPFIPNYKAYMTAHAKASNTDSVVSAVLKKHFPDMKAGVVAGKYATYKDGLMKKYGSAAKDDVTPSALDLWIAADPTRGTTWNDMGAPEKEQYNSREHWRAVKITEAVSGDLRNSSYKQYHSAITNRTIDIDPSKKKTEGTTTEDKKVPEVAAVKVVPPKVKTPAAKLKTQLNKLNKTFEGGTGKRTNVGGMVPNGDSVNKIFSYGQQAYSKDEWEKGPDAGSFSVAGAYGRQPDFMKTQKWSTKPQMYDYFLKNPEELKHIDGTVRTEIIKEIKKRTRDKLPKGNR